MILILLRHGQAAKVDPAGRDVDRQLTEKGIQKLVRSLDGLHLLIQERADVLIWTSPLTRARQTADVIATGFQVNPVVEKSFLENGDFSALSFELESLKPSACLILIGHEPHLGEWSQDICGCRLPFKKGAAAAFDVGPADLTGGSLLWFAQPGVLREMST